MIKKLPASCVAFTALGLAVTALPLHAQTVSFRPDGTALLENSQVKLAVANRPHPDRGIVSWFFRPTGFEMIDVLYGQTDYIPGHVFGERWDAVDFKGRQGIVNPRMGSLYVTTVAGTAADGSGAQVTQVSQDDYRLERTLLLRRDLATLEVRYAVTNIAAPTTGGFALRLHGALSPGARSKYQNKNEDNWLPLKEGPTPLDQALQVEPYQIKYGNTAFFLPDTKGEPGRQWARSPNRNLDGNWAVKLNRENGDGAGLIIEREQLLGFYGHPGATLEPVLRSMALEKGETWTARVYMTSFTGANGQKIVDATPLYVATQPLAVAGDTLQGAVVPLFSGTLVVLDAAGKEAAKYPAGPTGVVALKAPVGGKGWSIAARDTTGALIGRITSTGGVELSQPKVEAAPPQTPEVKGPVYTAADADTKVAAFLKGRDFTVYADFDAPDAEKKAARAIALKLGAGFTQTKPEGGKVLAVGSPRENLIVREAGLMRHSVSAAWPGAGRGAILPYENYEATMSPLLLVAGSDADGVLLALRQFQDKYLAAVTPPSGFDFVATSPALKIYPATRKSQIETAEKISLEMARGEYEPAQMLLTAYENLRGIAAEVAPLVNAATGKEIDSKQFLTKYQKRNGPLWLRWVNFFPVEPERGWTGMPDPLLERPTENLDAGTTQALWLTVIMPEGAAPGLYRSAITLKANGREKTIPIEVNVWDFVNPRQTIMGDPYMYMEGFADDLTRKQLTPLVENLMEHGMRTLHLGSKEMFRWHFSANGDYKGKAMQWLEVSDDGVIALDTSQFDDILEICEDAAKPYPVRYMLYGGSVLDKTAHAEFQRLLPQRHAGKPDRGASPAQTYYAQEMLALYKRHLEKRGLLNRFVLKIADEPRSFDYWYTSATQAAREVGLPIMTAFNNIDYDDAGKVIDKVAQWQVLYQLHNQDFMDRAKKAGTLVSWYNCGPPPRISAAATASEIRSYVWQAAKADLDLVSWWGIQCWKQGGDVWKNRYSSWDSVMYPAHPKLAPWQKPGKGWVDQAPIDSIRWEMIRQGMDDANYVYLLRDLIKQARQKGLAADADKAQAVLDSIWKNVYPTLNDYRPAYDVVERSRREVAQAIVELQPKLKPVRRAGL